MPDTATTAPTNVADRLDELAVELADGSPSDFERTAAATVSLGAHVLRELSGLYVRQTSELIEIRGERRELSETIGRLRRTIAILEAGDQ